MSDPAQLLKLKAGVAHAGRRDTEDVLLPTASSSRKRKTGRTADRAPSPHAGEPTPKASVQGRRSDLRQGAPERQRQRHTQTTSAHRRVPADLHRSRKANMANPRPLRRASVPGPPRTMLQHALHTALNSDPLVDSDEDCPDEHLRLDYNRRVQVITRLRGRPPTPEAECNQVAPA